MRIFDKVIRYYHENLPFVVYRKPNKNTISSFFIVDDELYFTNKFKESGFVFAPFNTDEKSILFPVEKSECLTEEIDLEIVNSDENTFFVDDNSKENHLKIVEKTIDKIKKSNIKKVVISRKELVNISNFDLLEIYKKLLQNYKNAFVYCWYHPKVGLWFGATPETLLNIENDVFKTMSLAGTQVDRGQEKPLWKSKELEEQQLVTDFIEHQLHTISSKLKIDKTETVKAGNLLHLRTRVEGKLSEKSDLKSLIRALHPTPAVCGLPRNLAKDFILENENYDRSFYTGFLGELNLDKKSSLFVNLRCMAIKNKTASIYIGGGITKDSKAKNEWQETVSKSKTMKRVLK
ncbi:chorismate-binding protein [Polaribacter vadi]|uniref:chorismate-binding protein n=1 Tax=Polaribacter TaxID=52959 RepID=UPI001C094DAF|nr:MULTISPECIES: chorismate-binding protein [Polaribacter]MBU3012999.1 chorismate-binding protein [Polaribacter vadi]MDO6742817.1 chorismate-binding protein [Polaribacter sp. 1_MG-2023]